MSQWDNADVIGGRDLLDKSELVGVEFLITGLRFERSTRNGVKFVYVTAERRDGTEFEFNDSSNYGVRRQLTQYLEKKGIEPNYDNPDEVHQVNILVPRGLRVSEFEVKDDRGRTKDARIYYLTSKR